jgi:hypothetical protein
LEQLQFNAAALSRASMPCDFTKAQLHGYVYLAPMNRANFFNPAGRALARDPVPIMIPCPEPIAGDDEAVAGLQAQHRLQQLKGMRA